MNFPQEKVIGRWMCMGRTYLRIALDALHGLGLGLALARRVLRLQRLALLLLDLAGVLATLVVLHGLRAHVDALAVLLHDEVGLGLAQVGADELGVELERLVAVVDGRGERQQLDVAGGAVRVAARVLGRPLDHLSVRLHRGGPVGLLELGVAQLACLLGFLWVDVGLLLLLDLGLLGCAQLGQDFGCAVLGLGLLVVGDGVGEVAQLLVCGTNARVRPGTCQRMLVRRRAVFAYLAMILKSA
jgi:hypothetical protein